MAATTEAAFTEAQVTTFMADTNLNPVSNEKRGEVHVTLVFDGVTFNPATLLTQLKGLGTVQSDNVPARNNYSFIIT